MPRLLTVEFCVGTAMALVLYVLDKSGKSNAYISSSFLIFIAGLLIHPALNIPWIWSPPNKAMKVWRASAVVGLIVMVVFWFGVWTWPESPGPRSSASTQSNHAKTAPPSELNPLSPRPQTHSEGARKELDLKVSALGIEYDQEKSELVAHLMFRNEGTIQRTVLSLTFIYWEPDRAPQKDYQLLSTRESESMPPGDVKPITINPQTEYILTYRRIIGLPYFAKVRGKIGIRINTTDPNGAVKAKELELMEIQKIALIGGGVTYSAKRIENVSLDE
jgi:hypothetical protein